MLIEVLISSVLLALIVIATFNGFDVTNRATASERSHSQADALAQQDEERMRSLTIATLNGFKETRTVTANGTVYTITSSAEFIADKSATKTCTGEGEASYIRTISKVTWPALGTRPPVIETGLIAPPAGGALLVKVFNAAGAALPGMTVQVIGPAPGAGITTGTTDTNGCIIFASLPEGEYQVTTFQLGYVDVNGELEPPTNQRGVTIIAGSTAKKSFEFDRGGAVAVKFLTPGFPGESGDTFLLHETGMTGLTPPIRAFGTVGKYEVPVTSPKTVFPFTSEYEVYAGTCEADKPELHGGAKTGILVPPGETVSTTVTTPPIKIKGLWTGTGEITKGEAITSGATGTLTNTGAGCTEPVRAFTLTATGALPHPGMPYGSFSLCVTAQVEGKWRRFKTAVVNTNIGAEVPTIYLGAGEERPKAEC